MDFNRDEMFSIKLAGEKEPPHVHIFVVQGEWNEWIARLEENAESPVGIMNAVAKELKNKSRKITITATEKIDGDQDGDLIVFPQRIRIPNGSNQARNIIEAALKDDFESVANVSKLDSSTSHVFVCCHQKRDKRCGYCGPIIVDKLRAKKISDVEVRPCAHVGGHIYAGNAVVFNTNGRADWLGYLTDEDASISMVLDLARGVIDTPKVENWRGRSGLSSEEHKSMCANCESQTDIEDLVADVPQVIFVLGGPGAGKGTQCERIASQFDFVHLSAGDLLRAERQNKDSKNGQLIESYIRAGKIVPVEITVQLLLDAMGKSSKKHFLIDGFPRNADNLQGWTRVVGKQAHVLGCLFYDCPESVMESRLLERGKTSGRSDDNIESIRARFKTYENDTRPIISHYESSGQCFRIVSDKPIDNVFLETREILMNKLKFTPQRPRVLFVLGGPGAGKGTQCALISEDFDFVHLSAGDLLRAERNDPNSKQGQLISNYIREGKIVPVEITVRLLMNAANASGRRNILIDGFPRNADNLQGWEKVVGTDAEVLGCLFFDCPEKVMESRLLERGKTSGRTDDNIESIRKRFHTYENETRPIIQHFEKKNRCFRINSDRSPQTIRSEVRSVMTGQLKIAPRRTFCTSTRLDSPLKKIGLTQDIPVGVKVAIGVAGVSLLVMVGTKMFSSRKD